MILLGVYVLIIFEVQNKTNNCLLFVKDFYNRNLLESPVSRYIRLACATDGTKLLAPVVQTLDYKC